MLEVWEYSDDEDLQELMVTVSQQVEADVLSQASELIGEWSKEEINQLLIQASQLVDAVPASEPAKIQPASRWAKPNADFEIEKIIRRSGVPTHKQTQWAVSIWNKWANNRKEILIENTEENHLRAMLIRAQNLFSFEVQPFLPQFF